MAVYREYGVGTVFSARAAGLAAIADRYFLAHPDQEHEGNFRALLQECVEFSARRNEIAHGVVEPFVYSYKLSTERVGFVDVYGHGFCLLPAYYKGKYYNPVNQMEAEYAYSSSELGILTQKFAALRSRVIQFRDAVFGQPEEPR